MAATVRPSRLAIFSVDTFTSRASRLRTCRSAPVHGFPSFFGAMKPPPHQCALPHQASLVRTLRFRHDRELLSRTHAGPDDDPERCPVPVHRAAHQVLVALLARHQAGPTTRNSLTSARLPSSVGTTLVIHNRTYRPGAGPICSRISVVAVKVGRASAAIAVGSSPTTTVNRYPGYGVWSRKPVTVCGLLPRSNSIPTPGFPRPPAG